MNIESVVTHPIFFEKNRVNRVYTGGALFADFFGDNSTDGYYPEEWIASNVKSLNKDSLDPQEGISVVRGTGFYFDELLKKYPRELLGERSCFGVLTKILDSAIRLPVQAHPDKSFSRIHFNSEFGKTESWLVLATRPGACLYFGFRDEISKEDFSKAVEDSRTNKDAMVNLLHRVEVKPSDVFLIPAKLVHAIGYGCLILEVQEPTDFTIQPEYWCGDYALNHQEMYIGLDKNVALDVFDYTAIGHHVMEYVQKQPVVLKQTENCMQEQLISYNDTPCFAVERTTLSKGTEILSHAPAIYVIIEGSGYLYCDAEMWEVKKGDYFFLPYAVSKKTTLTTQGDLQWVTCLPPV